MNGRLGFVVAAIAALPCAEAGAQTSPWAAQPTQEQYMAAYPAKARAEGVGGKVLLHCTVAKDGDLAKCKVMSEMPAGEGFGDAALSLTPLVQAAPGQTGKRVAVPLVFRTPRTGPAPPFRTARFDKTHKSQSRLGAVGPYMPVVAIDAKRNGTSVIECRLAADGRLSRCWMVSEAPENLHFGDAALRMAQAGWLKAQPAQVDGKPVDGERVQVSVDFTVPGGR